MDGPTPAAEADLDRILTIPNALSLARLALLGVFLWLLFGSHHPAVAAWVLAVTGTTDFLDGYVARRLNQVSNLGKVLDPTADRIVVGTSVVAIVVFHGVPLWLGLVVIIREVLVSAAVLGLAALGAKRIEVIWFGKAGTFGLMVCFPLFLLTYGPASWQHVIRDITWVLVVPSLAFAWTAALSYVPLAARALREGRAGRGGSSPPAPAR